MGNCLESWTHTQGEKEPQEEKKPGGFGKEGSFRVKILLTKEELDWLLLQLKEKGGKKLEDALVEIEKGRGRNEGWKPSLESIMESPEVQTVEMGCK